MTEGKKPTWCFPLGYKESFTIAIGLAATGIAIEIATKGAGFPSLHLPTNLIAGLLFIAILLLLHFFFRKNLLVQWLSSTPAATSAISLFILWALILAFVPQNSESGLSLSKVAGMSHITTSWQFTINLIFFLTVLGLTTIRRVAPLNFKSIGFFLNHAGLWLAVFAGSLGSGDMMRLKMYLKQNEVVWYAYDDKQQVHELPIALKLNKFDIEEYAPKIAIVDNSTSKIANNDQNNLIEIKDNVRSSKLGWTFFVKKYYNSAMPFEKDYQPIKTIGAAPAAYIEAFNIASNKKVEGWITCGSFMQPAKFFRLDEKISVAMSVPEPKRFYSDIQFYTKEGEIKQFTLEVNKPYKTNGWKLYQISYNEKMGKWSDTSVIELVKDPWLIAVYIGIFMLLAGAVYLFIIGGKIKHSL